MELGEAGLENAELLVQEGEQPAEVKAELGDAGLEGEESVIDATADQPPAEAVDLGQAEADAQAAVEDLPEGPSAQPEVQENGQQHAAEIVSGLREAVQREVLAEGESSVKRALAECQTDEPAKRIKTEPTLATD